MLLFTAEGAKSCAMAGIGLALTSLGFPRKQKVGGIGRSLRRNIDKYLT